MNYKAALALILPYFLSTAIYSILRFIYSVIITVAVYKDAKRRTFSSGIITFFTLFIPVPASAIYIIYVYLSARNDPNIVRVQFYKSFKKLMIAGYTIAVIDAFFFVLTIVTRGIGTLAGLFLRN